MSKNLLSNRDLNRYYDVEGAGIEPFLLTKKLDMDAESFRLRHGFAEDGVLEELRNFSATRKRLGHDKIRAPDNSVYNSATHHRRQRCQPLRKSTLALLASAEAQTR